MQESTLKRPGATANKAPTVRPMPVAGDHNGAAQRKLFIRTFGCQMNEYDSEKMIDVLNREVPTTVTQNPDEADIILFNTCSVREKAQDRKSVV